MLSGDQTGNGTPHDKYNIHGIAHARTNRKDNIFMQRRLVQNFTFILEWCQGTCSLTKHTGRWAYSPYFFPACCLLSTTFLSFPKYILGRKVLILFLDFSYLSPCASNQFRLENRSLLNFLFTFSCFLSQEER